MDLKGTNFEAHKQNGLERHQFEARNRLDLHKQDDTNLKHTSRIDLKGTNFEAQSEWT